MNSMTLFIDGKPVRLGKRVGKGGEGEVYALEGDAARVLKLYTIKDLASREAKVSAMLRAHLATRSRLVAFPQAIVRTREGKFIGFVMNFVRGHKPIFDLYSPAARKVSFPKADYRFLVRSALNISRAIAEVHESSCVIGDINHSGILVSDQAIAALIDADSFQISEGTALYLCKVGVKEYTPPELHGKRLDSAPRTPDHDNFGLSVVIFQLLCMGRHPFVGSYSQGEMPIERAITEYRFAYSQKRQVGMKPPPGAMTLADLPQPIGLAFETAFGPPTGSPRPTAKQWVLLLEALERQLKLCPTNNLHFYPTIAASCPWCRMEQALGITLFLSPQSTAPAGNFNANAVGFDLTKIWAAIEAVNLPPSHLPDPVLPNTSLQASDAAVAAQKENARHHTVGAMALAAAGVLLVAASSAWVLWIPMGIFGVFRLVGQSPETEKFKSRLAAEEKRWAKAFSDWERRCGPSEVLAAKKALSDAKSQFLSLPTEHRNRLASYEANRRDYQLRTFLESYRIRNAKIRGIGPAKEATLASYGIDTAASVNYGAIVRLPGFGHASAQPLLDWRRRLEARFVFSPQPTPADKQERDKIDREVAAKGDALRKKLAAGAGDLKTSTQAVMSRWKVPDANLGRAWIDKCQAETDWEHIGSHWFGGVGSVSPAVWFGAIVVAILVAIISNIKLPPSTNTVSSMPQPVASSISPTIVFDTPKTFKVTPKAGVSFANMRQGAGTGFDVIETVPAGEIVEGTGQTTLPDGSIWIAVRRTNGSTGYISVKLLEEVASPSPTATPICDQSQPWEDQTVCADADLTHMDSEMTRLLGSVRRALSGSALDELNADQQQWLSKRHDCSSEPNPSDCMKSLYRERIVRIRTWPRSEPPTSILPNEQPSDAQTNDQNTTDRNSVVIPATLRAGSISDDDYPSDAKRSGEQGAVTVQLSIDDSGRITACAVSVSSGYQSLDDASCRLVQRRFRFSPARNADGLGIASSLTKTIRWRLSDQ